jgi:hypothetical protein
MLMTFKGNYVKDLYKEVTDQGQDWAEKSRELRANLL